MNAAPKQRKLTPFSLAWAMAWPFVGIPLGMAALLALAAASAGLDPAEFAGEFLADTAVILTPLGLKCLGTWAAYSLLYLVVTWAHWPHYESVSDFHGLDSGLNKLFGPSCAYVLNVSNSAFCQWVVSLRRRLVWRGVRLAWSSGTHPKTE